MLRIYFLLTVVLLAGTVSCSSTEQTYKGMYQSFSSIDEMQMTRDDPSYDPVQAGDRNRQSYQDYKREREQVLKE